MKNKGFTLIELLAVIVILAIIALIATPIILEIIDDAEIEANRISINNYARAINNAIADYQVKNLILPEKFEDLTIEYDGDVKCQTKELYEDGTFYLANCTVNKKTTKYTYGKQLSKSCTLTDSDGNRSASVSDIVTCGTERFHVMYNTGNEITMLSMYNLNVGDNAYKSGIRGIQNENALGFKHQVTIYGNVSFSATNYWTTSVSSYPSEVFNSNSSIYGYVREYETYLTSQLKVISAKATLITYQQLLDLGCSGTTCSSAPSWVSTTSYWTATASDASNIWRVSTSKDVVGRAINYGGIGVRPVVTISTDELK